MARSQTRRRHGKHRNFVRLRQLAGDALAFVKDQATRLNAGEGADGVFGIMHAEGDSTQTPGARSNQFTSEDVIAAVDPTDIGLTPAVAVDGFSVDIDGIGEILRTGLPMIDGFNIGDTWTVSIWFKPQTISVNGFVFDLLASSSQSRIRFETLGATSVGRFNVKLHDTGGTLRTDLEYDALLTNFAWNLLTFTRTAPGTHLLYLDGSFVAPTTVVADTSFASASPSRNCGLGINLNAPGPVQSGRFHSAALFNVALSAAEITTIYNAGNGSDIDLQNDGGNYVSSANLQHYWRLGLDSPSDIGKDSGLNAQNDVNGESGMLAGAVGIDATDVFADAP